MKKLKFVFLSSAALVASFAITACNSGGGQPTPPPPSEYSFNLYFDSGRTDTLFMNVSELLNIREYNAGSDEHHYTFEYRGSVNIADEDEEPVYKPASEFVTVTYHENTKSYTVVPLASTKSQKIGIKVINSENPGKKHKTQWFVISERHPAADGGYNFSANSDKKSEVLGELEAYAMKNYLTGITLFENGGYVRKASRVHYGANDYVTGYGFGLLTEGYLDLTDPEQPDVTKYQSYLQSAQSSDPGNISGWNATGSQVGDLYGYITSSFWGTKLNAAKNGYEWYPVLAAEDCPDPIPVDPKPGVSIHNKYRVYVKTGHTPDGPSGEKYALYYRQVNGGDYDTDPTKFNNRPVELEDYITTFKLLLTKSAGLTRGAELATDTSYGLKGAYSYFLKTDKSTDSQAQKWWDDMTESGQLGIVAGSDSRGDYIDFEFLNPIDQFTAKYTLSSSLYSPLPQAYLEKIGGGSWIKGGEVFGTGSKSETTGEILKNVLCVGPYYLEDWITDQEIVFKRNDNWFEYVNTKDTSKPRYRIDGVHYLIVTAAQTRDDAIYDQFNAGLLDQTGIPASRISDRTGEDKPTKGDATFKLNVNACTQERWNELFWSTKYPDVKKPTQYRNVHPWMSNKNFLDGLFWSINRNEFAEKKGSTPSYNYFADAYMDDPIAGHSYNASTAHQKAEDAFDPMLRESGGYSPGKSTSSFVAAILELEADGKITRGSAINPTKLAIQIEWMYSNDETTYGEDIAKYFVKGFDRTEPKGVLAGYILDIKHHAGSQWEQVYNDHLMVGDFDLGFGAISGNTLNPLNFMEVLKSDNSSGFTLNWGADTAKVDQDDPIVFEVQEGEQMIQKEWSFDSAWAVADHGAVTKDGEPVDSVKTGYTTAPTNMAGTQTINRLANGAIMTCNFEFVEVLKGTVDFEISRIQISMVGYGSITIDESNIDLIYETDEEDPEKKRLIGFKLTFDNSEPLAKYDNMTLSKFVNKCLFDGLKLQKAIDALDKTDPDYQTKKEELENPFAYDKYGEYWWIDVYYNISIKGSDPTENYYMVKKINSTVPTQSLKLADNGGR